MSLVTMPLVWYAFGAYCIYSQTQNLWLVMGALLFTFGSVLNSIESIRVSDQGFKDALSVFVKRTAKEINNLKSRLDVNEKKGELH